MILFEAKQDINAPDANLTAKIDGEADKCLVALNRLEGRFKNLERKCNLSIGLNSVILIAVVAGIVLQVLFK